MLREEAAGGVFVAFKSGTRKALKCDKATVRPTDQPTDWPTAEAERCENGTGHETNKQINKLKRSQPTANIDPVTADT